MPTPSSRACSDSGLRAVFGYGNANAEWFPPNEIPTNYADIRRVRKEHFSSDDGLVTMAFAARGPQFTTLDITESDFKIARELGIRITVHVGDGLWGMSKPLIQMNARGLLKDDTTYVHCNTIGDDEFKLMGDTGGTASIAPELEMQMGHGLPPALRMLAVGIRPSDLERRGDDGAGRHVRRHARAPRRHAADGSHEGARREADGRAAAAVEPRRARIRDARRAPRPAASTTRPAA